jgi:hypothetical protein
LEYLLKKENELAKAKKDLEEKALKTLGSDMQE